jgi:hypothetical protein
LVLFHIKGRYFVILRYRKTRKTLHDIERRVLDVETLTSLKEAQERYFDIRTEYGKTDKTLRLRSHRNVVFP